MWPGRGDFVALVAYVLGFEWAEALLLGAIVSSTDAAAVFSVLRRSEGSVSGGVSAHTLEVESGINDPHGRHSHRDVHRAVDCAAGRAPDGAAAASRGGWSFP